MNYFRTRWLSRSREGAALLGGIAVLVCVAVLFLSSKAALAAGPAQANPTTTFTVTPTRTATTTITGSVTAATTGTTTVTITGTLGTPSGTRTVTRTPTPRRTATGLLPVTGADLTNSGGGTSDTGMWVALWILGLLLVIFGLRPRLQKH